jgi:DNA polymerase-3 subunit gamma/tau
VPTSGRTSNKAAAFAREAVVRDVEGNTLVLVFKHKIHANGVEAEPGPLLTATGQVLGGAWKLRCEVGGDQRPSAPSGATRTPAPARASAPARGAAPSGPAAPGRTAAVVAAPAAEDWPTTAPIGGAAPARNGTSPHDEAPLEEPPYDPEFDGPPSAGRNAPAKNLEGFDPGDEPTEDVIDAATARQTSEQQAIESLRKNFQVEKISDLNK